MFKRKGKKLSIELFKYYISFVILVSLLFLGAYLLTGLKITKYLQKNNFPLYDIVNKDYCDYKDIDINDLQSIGGYLEVLNSNKEVIYKSGKVPEVTKSSYTEEEFVERLSNQKDNNKYYVLPKYIKGQDGETYIALINFPIEKVSIMMDLQKIPYKIGKPIINIYIQAVGIALVLCVIVITFYSIWTSKKFNEPLKKIDEALGKVIDGHYEDKLELKGEREFVVISDTINFLIEKLKNSNEENIKLQESKSRLLIDLSHDIRTPITTIRGFATALDEGIVEEEKKQKYYKTIHNKAERVGELVDDLFEFVKMDSIQYVLRVEKVDICEFLRQIVAIYFDEIEDREFELEFVIPEDIVELRIDQRLFKRVITNLIENSLKYNPKGTKLTITVKEFNRYVMIYISDNGVGIPKEIRETLFEPFTRGDINRRSDGGSGLGLSIASKIVEKHGGDIFLEYPSEGETTRFAIRMYK